MTPIRGEQQPGFIEVMSNWLTSQSWYTPPKGRKKITRVGGLRLPAPEGDADSRLFLEVHILDIGHSEGTDRVSVPVSLRSRPSALAGKSAFIGKLASEEHGDIWVYDGTGDRAFLSAWVEMARRQQGSRNGRSRGEAFGGFQERDPFTIALRKSSVDSPRNDVTSTVVEPEDSSPDADWERKVLVEFFRRPSAVRDETLEELLTLTQANSTAIAQVLGIISASWLRSPSGGVEWESGDLAVIREAAAQAEDAVTLAKTNLTSGGSFAEEARSLGRALGTFHADLAGAFGAHPQTATQLKSMSQNAQQALSHQWSKVRGEFDEDEAADLNEVIDLMTMQLRSSDEPLTVQYIHGDLTLSDAHRVSDERWVFDEPAGFVEHAMAIRDVVTFLMAVANMVMETASQEPETIVEGEDAPEPINYGLWYEQVSRAFMQGYRDSDADTQGVDSVFFRAAMLSEALDLFSRWEGRWVFRPSMLLQVDS
ncbi:maltokinase N-terminal cap-like domain-containing protein [Nesterenkonia flava]|uniref:Maltokinase n=1 Tax=Nesterenkonia flava TaxID=469799 RepID=A0ABU1FWN1_9MICC|nr:hypothetical protein [Nesterenkonia flava]MDR5713084.1 hypothetical protein [Nesterenkonia flava]